jgi:hypothetical protein
MPEGARLGNAQADTHEMTDEQSPTRECGIENWALRIGHWLLGTASVAQRPVAPITIWQFSMLSFQ